jgi:hypothetical protein
MKKLKNYKKTSAVIFLFLSQLLNVPVLSQIVSSTINETFGLQKDICLSEKVYLHLDRYDYVAGENIWFKLYYTLNDRFDTCSLSNAVYLDIIDHKGQSVARGKYKIKNGTADGSVLLPTGILSGHYTIYAYTRWMMNFGIEQFFSKRIFIVNPEKGLTVIKDNQLKNDNIVSNPIKYDQPEVLSDKKVYRAREKVNLKIKTGIGMFNNKSSFSVSVAKFQQSGKNLCKENEINEFTQNDSAVYTSFEFPNKQADSSLKLNQIISLPETGGLIVSGKIAQKINEKPIPFVNIYISTLNNHIELQNCITDQDGKFKFMLNGITSNTDYVLQVADKDLKDYKITTDIDFGDGYSENQMNDLVEGRYDHQFYEDLVHNYQINKQFSEKVQENQISINKPALFYGKADSCYVIQKFVDMPTLEDFFTEIVGNVNIKKAKSGYELLISPYGSNRPMSLPPLLLLDGVPVFDVNKFVSVPITEIEKIDIINNYYILGDTRYGGIIHLMTKKKNFASLLNKDNLFFYQLTGFTKNTQFLKIKYDDLVSVNNRIPDFRNTLFWTPYVAVDENGEANVSFYTSDEKGKFLITLEGITQGAKPVKLQSVLVVE